jgi:hypothetical protein
MLIASKKGGVSEIASLKKRLMQFLPEHKSD